MQWVSLEIVGALGGLPEEVKRLEREGALTAEEVRHLDLGALAAFWQSDLGTQIRSHARQVRRELEFTARFSPGELPAGTAGTGDSLEGEFVVVQGAADLAVLLPGEIWLVDFKTDRLAEDRLEDRVNQYAPQLQLYGRALGRVYRRPVTRMFLHFLALKNLSQWRDDSTFQTGGQAASNRQARSQWFFALPDWPDFLNARPGKRWSSGPDQTRRAARQRSSSASRKSF